MNTKTSISVIIAMSLAQGGIAFGQGRGDHGDRGRGDDRGRGAQARDHQDRRGDDRAGRHDDRGRAARYERHDERGAGPNHAFHRGGYLPVQYRHYNYVVNDWRGHRLSAPPRGYHWVQTGSDYVLVAIATGVILQLLLSR